MENTQDHLHTNFHDTRLIMKVPQVTVYFWIIKILCTTVGETFADYLNNTLGFGLNGTTIFTVVVLAAALYFQFKSERYRPALYWLVVVLISIAGTLFTDNLTDNFHISLLTSSSIWAVLLAVTFISWYRSEKTLAIHSIFTNRREAFYWLTILFTFALGTGLGDLMAERFDLGYATSFFIFAGVILVLALLWKFNVINHVFAFWAVYVVTRPLGASIGDQMAQNDPKYGGWGLGTTNTSYIFLAAILILVIYLSLTKKDQIESTSLTIKAN
jgi:uncharacterized membrane-anchored protein